MVMVSVVIAVFNVEKYLKECLDSIVNQTLDDIEIICVNDGSTDGSLNILNDYASKDNRFKVFSQKNGGRGSASNLGMTIAKGKYLYLMDADDILKLNALEELYNCAEEKSVDVLMFQAINYVSDEKRYYHTDIYDMSKIVEFNNGDVFDYEDLDDLIFHIPVTPWSKLYNMDFIFDNDIKFPEGLIFEDNILYWDVIFNAKRIAFYEKCLYIRRRYSESIMGSKNKSFVDSIVINNLMIDRFKKYGVFDKFKKILYNRKINLNYNRFVEINDQFKEFYFAKLQEDYNRVISKGLYYDYFNLLDHRNKFIFDCCLNSESYQEFRYHMAYWDSRNTVNKLKSENKTLKGKNNELKDFNKTIKEDNLTFKDFVPLLNGLNEKFSNELLVLNENYNKLTKSNTIALKNNELLSKDLILLKKDNDVIIKENTNLKKKNDIVNKENSALKEKNDIIIKENSALKEKNDIIINDIIIKENSALKEKNDIINNENLILKENIKKINEEKCMLAENNVELVKERDALENELLQEKIKVSVVIPVYNVEEFLGECLDSIVNQTLKDIEIICVNDGSKDKSLEILNYYAENDDRFTVISQENGGHAVATNRGMDLARGKYLYLMDSDDFIELTALEEAYNYAEEKNVDFVIFQSMNYVTDEDRYYKAENYSMEKVADLVGESVFDYKDLGDLIFNITVTPWSKLYKTNFVRECGAKFPEGLIFDDNIFFWDVLFSAKKIAFYRKHLFNRRWYSYSSTTAGDQRFLDSIDINNLMIDRFKKYGAFDQFKEILYNRKVNMTYNRFVDIKPEFEKMFFEKLHADYENVVAEGFYDDYMDNLDPRNKNIFEFCLNSETYIEFKYQMAFWDASQTRVKKDRTIGDLKRQNDNIKKDVSNLKNERDKLKEEVNKLKQDINNKNELKNEIASLKDKNKSLGDDNKSLKDKNKSLEKKNKSLNKEISLYKSSNSWKMTKPLRNIKRKL